MRFSTMLSSSVVLLLLMPEPVGAARFTRTKDPTSNDWLVTDSATGLIWQGCPALMTGEACDIGSVATYSWQDALEYCEALVFGGFDDWRLPNRRELQSIVDDRKTEHSIDPEVFPAMPFGYFWSSSSYVSDSFFAWVVDFYYGDVENDAKTMISNRTAGSHCRKAARYRMPTS